MREKRDLGAERIWPLLLKLTIPTALAQLVNVLYAIIDRIYIGHIEGAGTIALAGVGIAAPITSFISSFGMLIGLGGAPLMGMREGHGEHRKAEEILSTAFYMMIMVSIILTPLFIAFREPLLLAFGATENTLPYASIYLLYYISGTIFSILSVGLNNYAINQGLSGKAMLAVLAGAFLNIVLDPIFIFTLSLGVKGAAIATVLSQLGSASLLLYFLLSSKATIRLRFNYFNRSIVKQILKYGLSPFIIFASDSILLIVLNAMLKQYGGEEADLLITAATIVQSFFLLIAYPLGGITGGTQGLLSYNFGAGYLDRVKETLKKELIIALVFTSIMFIVTMTSSELFARMFTDDDEMIKLSAHYMRIYASMVIPLAFQYVNVDSMTALGQIKLALPFSMCRKLSYIAFVLIFPIFFGASSVFLSEPVCTLLSSTVSTITLKLELPKVYKRREEKGLQL